MRTGQSRQVPYSQAPLQGSNRNEIMKGLNHTKLALHGLDDYESAHPLVSNDEKKPTLLVINAPWSAANMWKGLFLMKTKIPKNHLIK